MNRVLCILAISAAIAPGLSALEGFDLTKARIDTLLGSRLKPEPMPEKIANPFQFTGSAPPAIERPPTPDMAPGQPVADSSPSSDAEILAYHARSLRISGEVLVNGQTHLVINQSPYTEGDFIRIRGSDATVYFLRIVRIQPNAITLRYNDAEMVLPFKN